MDVEQTFIAVKPDGVQRSLIGNIVTKFENRGLKLVAIKLVIPSESLVEKHYAEHEGKPFFRTLVAYMSQYPVCAMVWEGENAVRIGRALIGATIPSSSAPGTLRGDFALDITRNVCHGSDTIESAKREVRIWFEEDEIVLWASSGMTG